jgi:ABC-type phosphate transport system ATPase subunit
MRSAILTFEKRCEVINVTAQPLESRPTADPVQVRRKIGMVFQKPNPFPNLDTMTKS